MIFISNSWFIWVGFGVTSQTLTLDWVWIRLGPVLSRSIGLVLNDDSDLQEKVITCKAFCRKRFCMQLLSMQSNIIMFGAFNDNCNSIVCKLHSSIWYGCIFYVKLCLFIISPLAILVIKSGFSINSNNITNLVQMIINLFFIKFFRIFLNVILCFLVHQTKFIYGFKLQCFPKISSNIHFFCFNPYMRCHDWYHPLMS